MFKPFSCSPHIPSQGTPNPAYVSFAQLLAVGIFIQPLAAYFGVCQLIFFVPFTIPRALLVPLLCFLLLEGACSRTAHGFGSGVRAQHRVRIWVPSPLMTIATTKQIKKTTALNCMKISTGSRNLASMCLSHFTDPKGF